MLELLDIYKSAISEVTQFTADNVKTEYERLNQSCKNLGLSSLQRVACLNQTREIIKSLNKVHNKNIPLPAYRTVFVREPIASPTDWYTKGKKVRYIVKQTFKFWEQKQTDNKKLAFTAEDVLASFVLCLICFSGVRDKKIISTLVNNVVGGNIGHAFINYTHLLHIKIYDTNHGNYQEADDVSNTHQIILDNLSRLWLWYFQGNCIDLSHLDWQSCLEQHLQVMQVQVNSPIKLDVFIDYANYQTEKYAQVYLDKAMSESLAGNIATCGLTQIDFDNYCFCKDIKVKKRVNKESLANKYQTSTDKTEQTKKSNHTTKHPRHDVYKSILHVFKAKKKPEVKQKLMAIAEKRYPESIIRLVRWLIYLLTDVDRNLAVSSTETYYKTIGKAWFIFTYGQEINTYDADDFEVLYENMLGISFYNNPDTPPKKDNNDKAGSKIQNNSKNKVATMASRLFDFHAFQVNEFQAESVNIPFFKAKMVVRAKLVSPKLYQIVLTEIDKRFNLHDATVLKLFFILSYRCGMRKSEILGLTYADIESLETDRTNFIVRPNHLRRPKSFSSIRRILLSVCLKNHEFNLLKDFLLFNQPYHKSKPIFTSFFSEEALAKHIPNAVLADILADVCDYEHGITPHSFRHTAITNFGLYLNGHRDLISALTDLTLDEVNNLKNTLVGLGGVGQQGWFAVASLSGHLHPSMTFLHYLHVSHLMATYRLSQSSYVIPAEALNNIGLSNQNFRDAKIDYKNGVALTDLKKLLCRRQFDKRNTIKLDNKHLASSTIIGKDLVQAESLFKTYGLARICYAIKALEEDKRIARHEIAQKFALKSEDLNRFYNNAKNVASLKNSHGNLRYFKTIKLDNHQEQLLPTLSKTYDKRLLQPLFKFIDEGYPHNQESIKYIINSTKEKLNLNETWINFSSLPTKRDQLLVFINHFLTLIPSKYVLIYVKNLDIKSELVKHITKKNKKIKLDIQATQDVSSVQIGIKHAQYQTGNKVKTQNRHFSPVLRYIIHLLMILSMEND